MISAKKAVEELQRYIRILSPCRIQHEPTVKEQILKIAEEVGEVVKAANKKEGRSRTAEEIADTIVSCITTLDMLGYDHEGRMNLLESVWEKNNARGYYAESC